jgi:REP element-mobilizing transposase RayT
MGLRGRSIFGDQGLVFFVTTTVVHHDPIFGYGQQYYLILIESLKYVLSKYQAALFAYVFMPSHIHLVVAMPEKKVSPTSFVTLRSTLRQEYDNN